MYGLISILAVLADRDAKIGLGRGPSFYISILAVLADRDFTPTDLK